MDSPATSRTSEDEEGITSSQIIALAKEGLARDKTFLNLSNKRIRDVPDEFVDMTKDTLKHLYLYNNLLETLPIKFSEYKVLRLLDLRGNRFRTIPEAVCHIQTLEVLYIGRNELEDIHPGVANLSALKYLYANDNKIRELPSFIADMTALQWLDVRNNRIRELPLFIADMTALQRLEVDDNPIEYPPQNRLPSLYDNDLDEIENTRDLKRFLALERKKQSSRLGDSSAREEAPTDSGYASAPFASILSPEHHAVSQDHETGEDDAATIYSNTSSLASTEKAEWITDVAVELFRHLQAEGTDPETMKRVAESLPDLLRAFALKVGYKAPSQLNRDVMRFVHKHRRKIAHEFELQRLHQEELEETLTASTDSAEGMSTNEKMAFWHDHSLQQNDDDDDDKMPEHNDDMAELEDIIDDDHGDAENNSAVFNMYREFLRKSPAYEWLLATLHRNAYLDFSKSDTLERVRQGIWDGLKKKVGLAQKISRRTSSVGHTAVFSVQWKASNFLKMQAYDNENGDDDNGPLDLVGRAITLTGTLENPQALTCEQYLCQTWPGTGRYLLRLIGDLVCAEVEAEEQTATAPRPSTRDKTRRVTREVEIGLPDGSHISAVAGIHRGLPSLSEFRVSGTADFIVEIGEQLAWLTTALSPSRTPPAHQVSPAGQDQYPRLSAGFPTVKLLEETGPLKDDLHFSITCVEELLLSSSFEYPNGQCWRMMFQHPVLVMGYPIKKRMEGGPRTGLEIPLNMMAGLVRTDRVNDFNSVLFLKGFSAMLVAVKHMGDAIYWHYLFDKRGERISYLEFKGKSECDLTTIPSLEQTRHIVGWCSDTKYYAGAPDANWNIRRSGLPPPHPGCLLEKVSISAGKIITGGASFAVGVRDLPLHVARQGYIPKLKWLSQKFVVFWDEEDKRGWLVNGTSAVLHTVRASLHHNLADDFSASCLFEMGKIKEANIGHTAKSAISVLTNPDNMKLPIYPEPGENYGEDTTHWDGRATEKTSKNKTTFYSFHNRVDDHYSNFEKMIDHQAKIAGQNGINMKARVRKHLEGWDFADFISDCDLRPRVATLHAYGYGWVDFVRSIQAPIIFGRGFGDLLLPGSASGSGGNLCQEWTSVPRGKYYLTTSVADLERIIDMFGDLSAKPLRICDGLVWFCPEDVFETCKGCKQLTGRRAILRRVVGSSSNHSDPVQALFPAKSRHVLPAGESHFFAVEEYHRGAVIWGHPINFGHKWREVGEELDAGEAEAPPALPLRAGKEATSHLENDSGIGSSLTTSTGNASASSRSSPGVGSGQEGPALPTRSFQGVGSAPRGPRGVIRSLLFSEDGESSNSATSAARRHDERYRNLRREKRRL